MSFTWLDFYNELFLKSVNNYTPETLADLAYKVFGEKSTLMVPDADGNHVRLNKIDPCTFLVHFNRRENIKHRLEYCKKAKYEMKLDTPTPDDFDGIPTFQPLVSRFFSPEKDKMDRQIKNAWKFSKDLSQGEIRKESFNRLLLETKFIGLAYITMICFIVWPKKYLPLDSNTRNYIASIDERFTYFYSDEYISDAFDRYNDILRRAEFYLHGKSIYELSRDAYAASKKESDQVNANKISYWVAGAKWGEKSEIDKTNEFIEQGVWKNGYSLYSKDPSLRTVRRAKSGDYIAIKSSATKGPGHSVTFTKVKAIGVIKENDRDGVNLKVDWLYKGPEFDIDGISYRRTFQRVKDEDIQKIFGLVLPNNQPISKINEPTSQYSTNEYNSNNPRNQIYFGPPGTGKTYRLLQMQREFEDRSGKNNLDYITKWVQDLTWWEVIAASLIEINRPVTIPDLFKHDLIQIKSRQSSTKTPKNTLWSRLQMHVIKESRTVNFEKRQEPLVVDKDNMSRWFLTGDWREQLADLITDVKEIRIGNKNDIVKRYEMVTFHQSYSYEEFVEGIRPLTDNDGSSIQYEVKPGIFKRLCQRAIENPNQQYAIFIDEINRGNISKIFGELITLIEKDKRLGKEHEITVTLPYSGLSFGVPSNLHIIGTMNSVDRSIALVDMALRRRFEFITMRPDTNLINAQINDINIKSIFETLNEKIAVILGIEYQLGHSYFMGDKAENLDALRKTWFGSVLPLLQEYLFDDWEKLSALVGDFVIQTNVPSLEELSIPRTTFGSFVSSDISDEDFIRYLKALE